jgi:ubiquinone/menaquinone biosynthesis C-methylase UbiE
MLERILEEEVMDTRQDADEYASFDNSAVNEEFVARALELAPVQGYVLDIGTGPADIAILLAQRAPGLRMLAIDLGEHMLRAARNNVSRAQLEHRVEVRKADAKATGLAAASIDLVISNSLVHHIPDPLALFREVARIANRGAGIFIKDLHRPDNEHDLEHLVATYASDCTDYQRRAFKESLHAGLTVSEVSALCARLDLPGVEIRRCSDRHWSLERRSASWKPAAQTESGAVR